MGRAKRWGSRSLVVLAISVVTVVALATSAGAETRGTFSANLGGVTKVCEGTVVIKAPDPNTGKRTAACKNKDGTVITCVEGDGDSWSCTYVSPRKKVESLNTDIRTVGGRNVREISDDSKVWVQTAPTNVNTVGVMQDHTCADLGGDFSVSADNRVSECRTPIVDVVCQSISFKNTCSGFADTAKNAKLSRKNVSASLKASSTTTPGESTATSTPATSTPGGSTTTTGATTTTTTTTTPQRR